MTGQAIIDSNVLVGLVDERDKWHSQAYGLMSALATHGVGPIYLDCVVNETITVLARRAQEQHRSSEFSALLSTLLTKVPATDITWISANLRQFYDDIIALVSQHLGSLHFNDALIALAAKELGIEAIASFDEDFDSISWLTRVSKVDHDQLVRIGTLTGGPKKQYALLVQGDSMSEAGIQDGDYILVEETNQVGSGDIVLVRLRNENQVTIRYFYPEGERVRLQPANVAFSPLIVGFAEIEVLGRIVDVIRGR